MKRILLLLILGAPLALAADPESLAELRRFEGVVPAAHLPAAAKRPSPEFLDEFYEKVRVE